MMLASRKNWRNKNKIFLHSPFTIYTFWLFISQELENNQGMTRKELVLERTSMSFVCWLGQQSSWPALRLKSPMNSSWEYQAWTPARNTGLSWLIKEVEAGCQQCSEALDLAVWVEVLWNTACTEKNMI